MKCIHLVHVIWSGSVFKEALITEVVNRTNHPVSSPIEAVPTVRHVDIGVRAIVGIEQTPEIVDDRQEDARLERYTGAELEEECSRYTWLPGWSRTPHPGKSSMDSECTKPIWLVFGHISSVPYLVHYHCVRLRFIHELAVWTEKGEDKDLAVGLKGDHLTLSVRKEETDCKENLVSPKRPLNPGKLLAKTTNLGGPDAQTHVVDLKHLDWKMIHDDNVALNSPWWNLHRQRHKILDQTHWGGGCYQRSVGSLATRTAFLFSLTFVDRHLR